MPTYDYVCAACGHELEVFQSISEPTLRKCPRCKKAKLERRIGPGAGILFKGGGFYQTDYRSESYKRGESSEKGGTKESGSTPGSTSDAKPAPAASAKTSKIPPSDSGGSSGSSPAGGSGKSSKKKD